MTTNPHPPSFDTSIPLPAGQVGIIDLSTLVGCALGLLVLLALRRHGAIVLATFRVLARRLARRWSARGEEEKPGRGSGVATGTAEITTPDGTTFLARGIYRRLANGLLIFVAAYACFAASDAAAFQSELPPGCFITDCVPLVDDWGYGIGRRCFYTCPVPDESADILPDIEAELDAALAEAERNLARAQREIERSNAARIRAERRARHERRQPRAATSTHGDDVVVALVILLVVIMGVLALTRARKSSQEPTSARDLVAAAGPDPQSEALLRDLVAKRKALENALRRELER